MELKPASRGESISIRCPEITRISASLEVLAALSISAIGIVAPPSREELAGFLVFVATALFVTLRSPFVGVFERRGSLIVSNYLSRRVVPMTSVHHFAMSPYAGQFVMPRGVYVLEVVVSRGGSMKTIECSAVMLKRARMERLVRRLNERISEAR